MKHRNARTIIALASVAAVTLGAAAATRMLPASQDGAARDSATARDSEQRTRVVMFVNRNTTIKGYVELDDGDVIVVQDEEGELHTHAKSRVLAIVELTEPEPGGQPGTVYLRNGQQRAGIIHEDAFDYVIVEIEGIRSKLRRDVVASVRLQPTLVERYVNFKKQLVPENVEAHLELCSWLVDNKMWHIAQRELTELLEKEKPGEAIRLMALVEAQLTLIEQANSSTDSSEEQTDAQTTDTAAPKTNRRSDVDGPTRLLDDHEINLIRVFELDFSNPPRLHVRPDVIRQIISEYSTNPLIPAEQSQRNAMFRAQPIDIVRLMFQLKARHLYGQVEVLSEPAALQKFHRAVHDAWLIRNCATSGCHGGTDAGEFQLHRRRATTERVRYTNMLILERLELPHSEQPLINYEDPYMSLLIQHALPTTLARYPHPEVDGWRPVFTRGNKELLQSSVEWITSMLKPRPDYPIEFDPNEPRQELKQTDTDSDAVDRLPQP